MPVYNLAVASLAYVSAEIPASGCVEMPKRGQGAECPDRLITEKRLCHRQIFWE